MHSMQRGKYISFSKEFVVGSFKNEEGEDVLVRRKLRFINSFRFIASGLDALYKKLSDVQCANAKKYYPDDK
jgi:hypothetical protein